MDFKGAFGKEKEHCLTHSKSFMSTGLPGGIHIKLDSKIRKVVDVNLNKGRGLEYTKTNKQTNIAL